MAFFSGVVQEVICPELGDVPNMVISLYQAGATFETTRKPFLDADGTVHLFVVARDGQISSAIEDFNYHKRREISFDRQGHKATFS